MAECSYSFAFDGDPSAFYRQAKDGVKAQGGSFLGDNTQGVVTVPTEVGDISFNYRRVPGKILIDVTEKPMLISCAQIADQLGQLIPKPAVKKKVIIDAPTSTVAPTSTTASKSHVTELPTQYITGEVPRPAWKTALIWGGVALGAVGILWLTFRRSSHVRYSD